MQPWINFYDMIGGAAATLMGLLFVSVSVNALTIMGAGHKHSKRLAEQAFQNYLAVLVISLIALIAGISAPSYGYSILGATASWSFWVLLRVYLSLSEPGVHESRIWLFRRYLASLAGFGLLVYSGIQMVRGKGYYAQDVAIALLVLLISATVQSWRLLISIAEEKYAAGKD
jgi:hypothetical protein